MLNILYTPSLSSKLEKFSKLDILHFHNFRTYQNYVAYGYSKRTNTPYILQAHGSIPRIGKRKLKLIYDVFIGYRLLNDASKVIAVTRLEAEQYKHMGVAEEKIAIIPNGIDSSNFEQLPPNGSFKKKFGIKEEEKIILFVGRINKIKGIDLLVKAFAKVSKELDNVKLVVVGPDDGYLGMLKKMIKSLGIENNILITGPLYGRDKLEAYVDASIVVCPSIYGIFDLVPIEAAMAGKALIVSNLPTYGFSEYVAKGGFGLLVNPYEIDQLKEAMVTLIQNEKLSRVLGEKARSYAHKNLTISRTVDLLEKIYLDVISNT